MSETKTVPEKLYSVDAVGRPERGFCRGGVHWPAAGRTIDLTDRQLAAVKLEPKVLIRSIDGQAYKAKPIVVEAKPVKFGFEPKSGDEEKAALKADNEAQRARNEKNEAAIEELRKQLAALTPKRP